MRLPAAGWYLRSLAAAKTDLARTGLSLKQGEKVAGVAIAITEGGASLRGRITHDEGQNLPENLRVYLVPAERENADDPLRFFEESVNGDGAFVIGNLAPGKYWLLAQSAERAEATTFKSARIDREFRAKLLKDATAVNKEISFKPCERTVDYEFRYPAAKP